MKRSGCNKVVQVGTWGCQRLTGLAGLAGLMVLAGCRTGTPPLLLIILYLLLFLWPRFPSTLLSMFQTWANRLFKHRSRSPESNTNFCLTKDTIMKKSGHQYRKPATCMFNKHGDGMKFDQSLVADEILFHFKGYGYSLTHM